MPGHDDERRGSRLRTVIALDDNEIGDRMRLPALDVLLIFRRLEAGRRRRIVRKFDHDVARAALAFWSLELAAANHEPPAELLEDGRVVGRIVLVAIVVV